MKRSKKLFKKVLALTLCMALMLSTLIFFNVGAMISIAADQTSANVHFVVPEVIYLKPQMNSGVATTPSDFQWYVGSTVNPGDFSETLTSGEKNSGDVFFEYANTSDAEISYKYLREDFSDYTASGCSLVLAGASIVPSDSASGTRSYKINANSFNGKITAGQSPALAANESGCVIEWTATFTDNSDNVQKCAKAYTYVYKPYVQPVGVAFRTVNETGSNHYGQNVAWISGINKVLEQGNAIPNGLGSSGYSLAVFSSSAQNGATIGDKYLQLSANYNFNPNNVGVSQWLGGDSAFSRNTMYFTEYAKSGSGTLASKSYVYQQATAPSAQISVDTSRYSNFNQIPNLTIGMFVTDDESSYTGAWYIADATGISEESLRTGTYSSLVDAQSRWDNHNDYLTSSVGTLSDPVTSATLEGIKYNGGWNKSIPENNYSSLYRIKFAYYNQEKGSPVHAIMNIGVVPVTVNAVNKAALRKTIRDITAKAAELGLTAQNTSVNNYTSETWNKFIIAYKQAYASLIKFDASNTEAANAASTLNTAYRSLAKPVQAPADVHFVVPEVIYLKPQINSGATTTTSTFQWYVGSTVNSADFSEALTSGEKNSGDVFFEYANTSGAEISYKYLRENLSPYTASGCSLVLAGTSIAPSDSASGTRSYKINSNSFNGKITAGQSPALSASESGCIIEWTVTYTDKIDNVQKCAKAYTYVYKPFVQPVGVAFRTVNETGSNHYGQNVAWISGINNVTGSGNFVPNGIGTNGYSLAVFSSSAANGTSIGDKYLQLSANYNFHPNNTNIRQWLGGDSAFNKGTIYYSEYEKSSSNVFASKSYVYQQATAPTAQLSVDTSRYTNFEQIPNLTIGMFVTDDENASSGAWYIADATGISEEPLRTGNYSSLVDAQSRWNNHNDCFASSAGTIADPEQSASQEGIKYNGGWNKSVLANNTGSTYRIKYAYYNQEHGSSINAILNIGVIPVTVKAVNKADLRKTIRDITAKTAQLGITAQNTSVYNYMPAAWNNFITAYKQAYASLIKFEASYTEVSNAANALKAAYDELLKSFDISPITAAISRYTSLEASDYTQESWSALAAAVAAAKTSDAYTKRVLKSDVDAVASSIYDAINALVAVAKADYTALDNAIAQAQACDSTMYTAESWATLETALAEANAVDRKLAPENQSVIDTAEQNLMDAINALVFISSDMSALETVVDYALTLESNLYTTESWASLQTEIDAAIAILNETGYVEQDEIDSLVVTIRNAINALVYKSADYTALNAVAATAASLDASAYTEESWQTLQDALGSAVYGLDIAHQVEVDAATVAIQNAIDGLVVAEHKCTEHSWGDWYVVKNPTTTATGLMRRDCANCDEVETLTIPKLLPTAVTGVNIGAKSIALSMGDMIILAVDVMPATAENQNVTWESSDPNVVTVTSNGKLKAVGVGVANIIVRSEENPGIMDYCMVRVASLVTSNTTSVIDNETGLIYGLDPNLTSADINDYVGIIDETTSIVIDSESIGTGTEINVVRDNEIIDTFTAVIFGDANGDAWYDGMDAMIVSCLVSGMMTKEDVGEAVYMAADCNHDGVIDQLDVDILQQAGVLLSQVDQSKSEEELLETSSAYVEYLNLIDQNVSVDENTTDNQIEEPYEPSPMPDYQLNIFEKIIAFFMAIWKYIFSFMQF